MNRVRFGSVCSGIEAASVAWEPLGWRAAWLSEIEPFPSAVLAHHYPDVPNLGDMTALPGRIRSGEIEAPDVFCGGTPCQAFSVAGLRRSLDDARGNLSLTFCEIADAIDAVRHERGEQPAIVFWENVPGVLSTADNAFGCFLAGLAGEDDPLVAPGGKWANAGYVLGPQRAIAWRTLDAQYFGVAQRRRRVFVVASARAGFDPAAVLFEFDGLRRDSAPRREAGKGASAGTLRSTDGGSDVDHARAAHLIASGNAEGSTGLPFLTCSNIGKTVNNQTPLMAFAETTHTLRGEGFDASEDGTGRGTPLVPTYAVRTANTSANGHGISAECAHTLDQAQGQAVAFAIQAGALRTNPASGPDGIGVQADHAYTLEARAEVQAVAHPAHCRDVAQTITSNYGKQVDSSDTALGPNVVAFHPTQDPISSTDGTTHCIGTGSSQGGATVAVAFDTVATLDARRDAGDFPGTDGACGGHVVPTAMQVRRLTPRECEALQGFPQDYTAIPWRKKPASECPDGPRYKALGNSWAVPVVRWIGRRIDAALRALEVQREAA